MNVMEIRPGEGPVEVSVPCRARRSHRILVVDDESAVRTLMTAVLDGFGYDVDTAEDGAVAWDALRAKEYDLLIIDHNMPNLTGVEVVKNLRSASMGLPVVMVTGDVPDLGRNPSLQIAATILKPFNLDELLDAVTSVLGTAE